MSLYTTECRLTASGLDDLILPISTVSVRMRHQLASYMSWTLPDPLPYTDQIIDRISGNMLLYCSIDDGELVQVLRTFLRNIYFTQGSKNMVLTLAGDRQISFAFVGAQIFIDKVIRRARDSSGVYTLEANPDFSLTPRYIVDFGGANHIRLDTVFFNIGKENATMTMSGLKYEVALTDLAARWMLDEGAGTFAEDIKGDCHGELEGPPEITTWDLVGEGGPEQESCLHITEWWTVADIGVKTGYYLSSGDNFPLTFEAWINTEENESGCIISNLGTASEEGIWWDDWSNMVFYMAYFPKLEVSMGSHWARTATPVPENEWIHIAAVIEADKITVYFNGVEQETEAGSLGSTEGGEQPYPLRIGWSYDLFALKGKCADVRVWTEARSQAQIQANMNAGKEDL